MACSDISINPWNRELVDNAEENEIPSPMINYLTKGFFDVQQGKQVEEVDNDLDAGIDK